MGGKIKKTFYDWCIENKKEKYLSLWDYSLNTKTPKEIGASTRNKFYFKCYDNIHESFLKDIHNLVMSKDCICPKCNSFYNWCIKNNREDLIKCWSKDNEDIQLVSRCSSKKYKFNVNNHIYTISISDITNSSSDPIKKYNNSFGVFLKEHFGELGIERYWSDKNTISPYDIDRCSGKLIWIKCIKKEYHDDYQINAYNFVFGNRCPGCASKIVYPQDSFAQYNINKLGKDFLDKYWCKDNKLDPWKIPPFKNKPKIKIQCQHRDYHQFWVTPGNFSRGYDCPLCNKKQLHINDSLGVQFPKIIHIWSDKNLKTPYEYRCKSHDYIWLKCDKGIHEDYKRRISDYTNGFNKCSECVRHSNISSYEQKVSDYLNTYPYTILHEEKCTLVPINEKTGYKLPYDNEVKELKLIIEVNGIQHYEENGWHITQAKKSNKTPTEEFKYQQWKDEYKKQYARSHGYKFLEISFWNVENGNYKLMIDKVIESIVKLESVSTAGDT